MTPDTIDRQEKIRRAVESLVMALTERQDVTTVQLVPSHRRPKLILTVHRMDYGAVLGKRRSMLDAINLLVAGLGMRHGLEVAAVLEESEVGDQSGERRKFVPSHHWDSEPFVQLVTTFLSELLPGAQVSLDSVSNTTSKLSILAEGIELWAEADAIEKALELVFNCAGIMQGHRILTELIT